MIGQQLFINIFLKMILALQPLTLCWTRRRKRVAAGMPTWHEPPAAKAACKLRSVPKSKNSPRRSSDFE